MHLEIFKNMYTQKTYLPSAPFFKKKENKKIV